MKFCFYHGDGTFITDKNVKKIRIKINILHNQGYMCTHEDIPLKMPASYF